MSTDTPGEQATLGDVSADTANNTRSRSRAQGAVYGRSQQRSDDPTERGVAAECQCGASVERETARVMGDSDGVVPCCQSCAENSHGAEISTTTRAVQLWHSARTTIVSRRGDEVVQR
jgi:hypothetical protein